MLWFMFSDWKDKSLLIIRTRLTSKLRYWTCSLNSKGTTKCRTNIRKTRLAWSWHEKNAMRIDPINKISELRHRFFINVASAPLRAVCLLLEACFNSARQCHSQTQPHKARWKFSISADLTFQVHGKSQCQMRFAMVSEAEIGWNIIRRVSTSCFWPGLLYFCYENPRCLASKLVSTTFLIRTDFETWIIKEDDDVENQ